MVSGEGQWGPPEVTRPPGRRTRGAFTLIELLISIAIIGVLLAILLPAIGATMKSARAFRCQMSLRSVAFDFTVFADDDMHGDRGHDAQLGPRHFRLETFIESQYGIDEFWNWGSAPTHTLPDAAGNDPMRCPDVRGEVTVTSQTPCSQGAMAPPENVSFGFNMRLHVAEVPGPGGQLITARVKLTSAILDQGTVPLAWDVSGAEAGQLGAIPLFSAPALGNQGAFSNVWFPAARHQGKGNHAFIDGSVRSSGRPLEETGWGWGYKP